MIFLIFSLILHSVVAAQPIASPSDNNQKIYGGFDAYQGQFPYQASLRHLQNLEHFCGGSIISNQWILTSATCLLLDVNQVAVVVGSIYLNSGGDVYNVLFGLRHPNYNQLLRMVNDIGLIRVKGQINFNNYIRPIQLTSESTSVGLPLTVAGWGYTGPSSGITNTLQHATFKSISNSECKKLVRPTFPLYDTMLCTSITNGQRLCSYDYGSPLVFNGQQHAIASMSPGYCIDYYPDSNTRVTPFRSWIREITNV